MAIFHWKIQRISAILLVPAVIYITFYFLNIGSLSYLEVINDITSNFGILFIIFVAIVVIGGAGTVLGPLFGSFFYTLFPAFILVALKTFEINDLGFNKRNDSWYFGTRGGIRKQQPWGRFLKNELKFRLNNQVRGDGLVLNKSLKIEQQNDFKNYWSIGSDLDMNFASFNDNDTFRDEDAWVYRSETMGDFRLWLRTDRRKKITADVSLSVGRGEYSPWENRFGLKFGEVKVGGGHSFFRKFRCPAQNLHGSRIAKMQNFRELCSV